MQDRFIKIMLIIVAGLLAANLGQSLLKSSSAPVDLFESKAQAQDVVQVQSGRPSLDVLSVKGYTVQELREVIALGDGKTFVVSNPKGFMVYQVVPGRR